MDPPAQQDRPGHDLPSAPGGGGGEHDHPAAPRERRGGWFSDMPELVQASVSLLVLAGAGLYAAIRFGQQVFYNQFDVRPEEVGLTYAATVSRAAVILVAVSSAIAFYYAVGLLTARLIGWLRRYRLGRFAAPILQGVIILGALGVIAFLLLAAGYLLLFLGWVLFSIAWFVRIGWSAFREFLASRGRGPAAPNGASLSLLERGQRSLSWPSGVLVVGALLSFTALVISGASAVWTGNRVRDGEAVTPASGFGLLGLNAQPVLVIGDLPENLELSNRAVTYLGQADGTVVLYDRFAEITLRVPADGIAVIPGSSEVETVTLRPGHALDLDLDLDLDPDTNQIDGLLPVKDADPLDVELSWNDDELVTGAELDPTSLARAGLVDDALVPSRNACTRLKQPFQRLAADDLHSKLRMCVHTTGNLWALLTVTGIRSSPPELTLEVVTWPA